MKLFTIGDSISQGFMSGAAARTDLSYSTIISKIMGLNDYTFPKWQYGGLPLNIEDLLRSLNKKYGNNIRGLEWLSILSTINRQMDGTEDYYERGQGREDLPYDDDTTYFHNIAVRGFDIADAWLINSKLAKEGIEKEKNGDSIIPSIPSASFYRTALKVLNPSLNPKFDNFSSLDWLNHHVINDEMGVENLCLWLGNNNALASVVDMNVKFTPGDGTPARMTHEERTNNGWTLWNPFDFEVEYEMLLEKVNEIMLKNPIRNPNWKVFLGTIPLITIVPLAKGVGEQTIIDGDTYYKYYTYVPFDEEFAMKTGIHLNMKQAIFIDKCINEYNQIIKKLVSRYNEIGGEHYHIVDISDALYQMAWKRNQGKPTFKYPSYFDFKYPVVDTKFYHVDRDGHLKNGGLFSLDGVHPSAVGQGIIANEFLKVMVQKEVEGAREILNSEWDQIFNSDKLLTNPITIMSEIYEHNQLAEFIVKTAKLFKKI